MTPLNKKRKVHRVLISQNSNRTFSDTDFIVYCQKALFSNDRWHITIEDWPSGYCEAYTDTLRLHHRWKPLTLYYEAKGNYIYVCRTLTRNPKLPKRPHSKPQRKRNAKKRNSNPWGYQPRNGLTLYYKKYIEKNDGKNSFALSSEWEDDDVKC